MTFEELVPGDFATVFDLLNEAELDYSDLKQPGIRLFQLVENGILCAVGGLEIRDGQALLRSVAVKKNCREQVSAKNWWRKLKKPQLNQASGRYTCLQPLPPDFFRQYVTGRSVATILQNR